MFYFLFYNTNPIERSSDIIRKINNITEQKDDEKQENEQEKINLGNWYIEIPSINLSAPIADGTDSNTLNNFVGHFIETAVENGNVGLAGHNRGYEHNYFQNLKKLKKGDKIVYSHDDFKKEYIVDIIEIIDNSNWNYLKESEDNRITLITCVENEPKYRRCIQAFEMEF